MMNNKKQNLANLIINNSNNGEINLSQFRKNYPSEYATISYYFGNINSILEELKLTKITKFNNKNAILRDKLAYSMLVLLRKNYTLQEISEMYGVTKPLVNQLMNSLNVKLKSEELKKKLRE